MKPEKKVTDLINQMDLDEKIGALLTLGFSGTMVRSHIYDQIETYKCGGLRLSPQSRLFGSYVDPKSGKEIGNVVDRKGYRLNLKPPTVTLEQYRGILKELQQTAMNRRLGIPLHFSFDQEGGSSADFWFNGVKFFPKPMGIRATGDPEYAYLIAKAVSRQSRAVGFNWIHSPVLDVNVNPQNPEIYTRSYSNDPEVVAEYALKSCQGFQEGGLIATGKHFPGRGDSAMDAHFGMPIIPVKKDVLLKRELLPYRVLIEHDLLPSIMIAHTVFPAIDEEHIATVSKKVITGLLRDEMGFEGVITTDSMTMGAVAGRYGVANACAMALEAGADLVLMKAESHLVADTVAKIKEFVVSGRIPMRELDQKVERVLSLKYRYGLFQRGMDWDETPSQAVNAPEVVELSKTVAKKSILLLQDDQQALPLSPDDSLLLVEQVGDTPNTFDWHPGVMLKEVQKYHRKVDYMETHYTYDDLDKKDLMEAAKDHSVILLTSFYKRGHLANNEAIDQLIDTYPDKKIVVLTNTPYPISIPQKARTLFLTLSTGPDNIEAAVAALFGKLKPEGQFPV